jgi:hypothetical protein
MIPDSYLSCKERVMTMQLDDGGRALRARHADWWQQKTILQSASEGPALGDLWLPLANGQLATEDLFLRPEMLDFERVLGEPREPGPLEHGDTRFSVRAPYGRVPWVEAVLGCPIRATIQGGSMRAQASITRWEDWDNRPTKRDEQWFDLFKSLIEALVDRSGGRYAVVQPTMRGPTDLAEAVLGPQLMCLSMYDHPTDLHMFLDEATDLFIEMLEALHQRIPAIEGGHINAYGLWAPGTTVRTQCDASAILSPKQYAEWFLPYDESICRTVDYALMHLHSCSLHTVEALLKVESLRAFEVTLETGGPGARSLPEMVPTFRKMLDGRSLILYGPLTPEDENYLLRELPHGGLSVNARRSQW